MYRLLDDNPSNVRYTGVTDSCDLPTVLTEIEVCSLGFECWSLPSRSRVSVRVSMVQGTRKKMYQRETTGKATMVEIVNIPEDFYSQNELTPFLNRTEVYN